MQTDQVLKKLDSGKGITRKGPYLKGNTVWDLSFTFYMVKGVGYATKKESLGKGSYGNVRPAVTLGSDKLNISIKAQNLGELPSSTGFVLINLASNIKADKVVKIAKDVKDADNGDCKITMLEHEYNMLKKLDRFAAFAVVESYDKKKCDMIIKGILVEDFVEGKTLHQFLKEEKKISYTDYIKIMKSIMTELISIHAKDVIHGDLHLDNILIARQQNGTINVTIIDFGLANRSLSLTTEQYKKSSHLAPEFENKFCQFTRESDIYSIGMIFEKIGNNTNLLGDEDKNLYKKMQAALPGDRPSTTDVLNILNEIEAEYHANGDKFLKSNSSNNRDCFFSVKDVKDREYFLGSNDARLIPSPIIGAENSMQQSGPTSASRNDSKFIMLTNSVPSVANSYSSPSPAELKDLLSFDLSGKQ